MLHARFREALTIKKIVDALKELTTEVNVHFSELGLSVQAMDNAHVSLVSLVLRHEAFASYQVQRAVTIGLKLDSLAKTMGAVAASDSLTWEISEAMPNVLQVMLHNHQQTRVRHFGVKLMDLDVEAMAIPDVDYACVARMPSAEFKRALHDLHDFSDSVALLVNKNGLTLSVNGDVAVGSICFPTNAEDRPEEAVRVQCTAECRQKFTITYLLKFAKASALSASVMLKQSDGTPLVIEYAGEWGVLQWFLAPKVD
jgi:proliferating cell nuclear antigen